jgi:DNA-binding transcriptional ArsR family regulator
MTVPSELDCLVRVYKALGDGTRLRLVKLLADLEPGDALCVNALAAELGVSQPAVSQHLGVLRAADLVIAERRGYHVHYRLDATALSAYRGQILALLGEAFMGSPSDASPPSKRWARRRDCQAEHMHDDRRAGDKRSGHRRPS